MKDISDGIVGDLEADGREWPVSGDNIARQRAGLLPKSLIGSIDWPEEGWAA
jgi:hypothetical protein